MSIIPFEAFHDDRFPDPRKVDAFGTDREVARGDAKQERDHIGIAAAAAERAFMLSQQAQSIIPESPKPGPRHRMPDNE